MLLDDQIGSLNHDYYLIHCTSSRQVLLVYELVDAFNVCNLIFTATIGVRKQDKRVVVNEVMQHV